MQRHLRVFTLGLRSLGTRLGPQLVWRDFRSTSGLSFYDHQPVPLHASKIYRKLCHLFFVSHKQNFIHPPHRTWFFLHHSFSDEPNMAEQRFIVEYAKRGTAGCKKCKDKIAKGIVRIGKVVPNPFSESAGEMKEWYHVKCIFEKLERARATTKKIEDITELEGWEELQDEDKELINKHVSGTTAEYFIYSCIAVS